MKQNDFLEMENKRMGQQMHDLSEQNADLAGRVEALDAMTHEFERIVAMDVETREHTVKHIEEHNAIADEHAQASPHAALHHNVPGMYLTACL